MVILNNGLIFRFCIRYLDSLNGVSKLSVREKRYKHVRKSISDFCFSLSSQICTSTVICVMWRSAFRRFNCWKKKKKMEIVRLSDIEANMATRISILAFLGEAEFGFEVIETNCKPQPSLTHSRYNPFDCTHILCTMIILKYTCI